jgi:hypothetical protein
MTSGIALLVALTLFLPGRVLAAEFETPSTSARLTVHTDPGCTSRDDIAARVTARSSRIHFVEGDSVLSVEATFGASPSGAVAVALVVAGQPAGKAMSRRFSAGSCSDAADAAALIIAVTLDPTSGNQARPATAVSASGARSSGAGDGDAREKQPTRPNADAAAKVAEQAASPEKRPAPPASAVAEGPKVAEQAASPEKRPAPPASAVAEAQPSLPVATRRRASLHLMGQMVFGPAPAVMPGVGLYAMAALDREDLWSPAVVLGAMHAWRSGFAEAGGTAAFTLDAASLDACGIRVRVSVLEGRACASARVGRLLASGSATTAGTSVARLFATAGGTAIITGQLGPTLELAARIGAGATLVRDWYLFGTNEFHRAARVTVDATLGLGLRW